MGNQLSLEVLGPAGPLTEVNDLFSLEELLGESLGTSILGHHATDGGQTLALGARLG